MICEPFSVSVLLIAYGPDKQPIMDTSHEHGHDPLTRSAVRRLRS